MLNHSINKSDSTLIEYFASDRKVQMKRKPWIQSKLQSLSAKCILFFNVKSYFLFATLLNLHIFLLYLNAFTSFAYLLFYYVFFPFAFCLYSHYFYLFITFSFYLQKIFLLAPLHIVFYYASNHLHILLLKRTFAYLYFILFYVLHLHIFI